MPAQVIVNICDSASVINVKCKNCSVQDGALSFCAGNFPPFSIFFNLLYLGRYSSGSPESWAYILQSELAISENYIPT